MSCSKSLSTVHYEVVQSFGDAESNVFVICMDRPDLEHNIIDKQFGVDLVRAVHIAEKRALCGEIDTVIICSAKKGSFMAGADILHELKFIGSEGAYRSFKESYQLQQIFCAVESLSVPTIALMNGITLGGGLELALACDFRIADTNCKQIGLPEVKLGVLPGGGGCIRLPRLVGFRRALGFLITGQTVNAHKAFRLGVVDALMPTTQSSQKSRGGYEYTWLLDVLKLVKTKGKSVAINKHVFPSVVASMDDEEILSLTEDQISATSKSWNEYHTKSSKKYGASPQRITSVIVSFLAAMAFSFVALVQTWRTVGLKMPAPYVCLLTTLRCHFAGTLREATVMNAAGFANLATTAESKSLMNLFLSTRRLKKAALCFGCDDCHKDFDLASAKVIVLVSKRGMKFSAAVIQGLLYNKLPVSVLDVSHQMSSENLVREIQKLFQYSVKRGYLTNETVDNYISNLHFFPELPTDISDRENTVVVDASIALCDGDVDTLISETLNQKCKVYIDAVPGGRTLTSNDLVNLNLGDPVRKNTLCVEISPATRDELPSSKLRAAASLMSALGKMPVITLPSTGGSLSLHLTLCHWNMAATILTATTGLNEKAVDGLLRSAGFMKGVFETIRTLDKDYVLKMISCSDSSASFIELKTYITDGLSASKQRSARLIKGEISDLLLLNMSVCCLKARESHPGTSEAAIDALCVSGLIQYPPSEGGPLNYLVRNGKESCIQKFKSLIASSGYQFKGECAVDVNTAANLFSEVCANNGSTVDSSKSDYCQFQSEGNYLTSSELVAVGPAHGMLNREVFLSVFMFNIVLLMFFVTVIFLPLIYLCF